MSQKILQFAVTSLAVVFAFGCSKPAAKVIQQKSVQSSTETEREAIREGLNRPHPDSEHLRNMLTQLNGILNSDAQLRPTPLSSDESSFLKDRLKLTDSQIAALNAPEFGLFDAHLLDQALLFRDVARTLELKDPSVLTKANVALDWVTRHVRLEQRNGLPDPPDRVILRGRGTPLERIYVFLALLQQLDVEAYCVGDEAAATDPNRIWGVAIRNGELMEIFDPRLGIQLPSGLLLPTLLDMGYDVTGERLAAAKFYWGLPTSVFAPRWKLIESYMRNGGLHVQVDVNRLKAATEKIPLLAWAPNATGTPTRVLAEFLPTDEGGLDRSPFGPERRMAKYQIDTIPWSALPREFAELQGPLGNRIRLAFVEIAWRDQQPGIASIVRQQKRFIENRRDLESQIREKALPADQLIPDIARDLQKSRMTGDEQGPTLMELLLRGEHSQARQAMRYLIDELTQLRNKNTSSDAALEWAAKAQSVFAELLRAQRTNDETALHAITNRFVELQRESSAAVEFVQQKAAAPALQRLNFLVIMSKHDQADASSRREPNSDSARAAWKTISTDWANYLNNFPNAPETHQVQRLHAAALERSGQRETAADAYRRAAGSTPTLYDRIADNWLAKNISESR